MLTEADEDLPNRLPVWEALSDLFLDTDIASFHNSIAQTLSSSPYSIEELETILRDEVYPVCIPNLLSVAGEWAGFNQTWLQQTILKNLAQPRYHQWVKAMIQKLPFMDSGWKLIEEDWSSVKKLVQHLKSNT